MPPPGRARAGRDEPVLVLAEQHVRVDQRAATQAAGHKRVEPGERPQVKQPLQSFAGIPKVRTEADGTARERPRRIRLSALQHEHTASGLGQALCGHRAAEPADDDAVDALRLHRTHRRANLLGGEWRALLAPAAGARPAGVDRASQPLSGTYCQPECAAAGARAAVATTHAPSPREPTRRSVARTVWPPGRERAQRAYAEREPDGDVTESGPAAHAARSAASYSARSTAVASGAAFPAGSAGGSLMLACWLTVTLRAR